MRLVSAIKVGSIPTSGPMPYKDKEKQREYQKQWMASRRADFFKDKSCVECKSVENLELDHIDPSKKITHNIWSWSKSRREEELAKCQVLCKECHKEKTREQFTTSTHGTYAMRVNHGCECEQCKEYIRRIKREWRARTGKN